MRYSYKLAISALLPALLIIVIAGCGSDPEGTSVTGEVIAVEARSITEFETLTIVDDDGRTWEFRGGAFSGFTPSHLREHQALGDPVKVWFVEDGDGLLVTAIEDG